MKLAGEKPAVFHGVLEGKRMIEVWLCMPIQMGSEGMTVLTPGESTISPTEEITMRSITKFEYAGIDDINIRLTGYAIGVGDVSVNPIET